MTHETKMKVKMDFYEQSKKDAVKCLQAMDAEVEGGTDPNSWEGVMQMVSDAMQNGSADKKAAAVMAAAKWSWANCECQIHKHVAETKELIEKEVEAANDDGKEDEPKGNGHAEGKPVTEAAPAAVASARLTA